MNLKSIATQVLLQKILGSTILTGMIIFLIIASMFPPPVELPEVKEKSDSDIMPGDKVQWESNGTYQFTEPKEVVSVINSKEGKYIMVEGATSGVPYHEAFKV